MQWERSNVIGLARASCTLCHGYGLRPVLRGEEYPCNCVFRAVFKACYRRFRECVALGAHTNAVTWERCGGPSGYRAYSRKREEFMADFVIVSRRTLEDLEYGIFRSHFLLGADFKLCCPAIPYRPGHFLPPCLYHPGTLGPGLRRIGPLSALSRGRILLGYGPVRRPTSYRQ
jgi:hypothetical protein